MRRHIFALTCISIPLAAALAVAHGTPAAASAQTTAAPSRTGDVRGVELDALDRKADPCADFYQFACGGWIARNPLPPDRSTYGRFAEVQDRNFTILRRILETPAGTSAADAKDDRHRAADYYAACMDESKIEASGVLPIASDLLTIDELVNPDDLPVLLARLHAIGVPALFRFGARTDVLGDSTQQIADVDQADLSLPDRDYYLKSDARSVDLRDKFVATVEQMLTLSGARPEQAAADAKAVLSVETALASAMLDRVQRRDPRSRLHTLSMNELQAMTPNFSWRKYATAAEAPRFQVLNVAAPDYLKAVDRLVGAMSAGGDLKAYLRWHVVHQSADLLPKPFADADFDFFRRTLNGQQQPQPRWRRCVTETDQRMGEALGKAFVEEAFGPQAKADMLKMVQDIKGAMQQDIDAAPWISGETKKAAMLKLKAVVDRIGYPDAWRDYSSLTVSRDEAIGNRERALAFDRARTLAKIGQPVDRGDWSMTPPTVNAYYSPDRNNINFPV